MVVERNFTVFHEKGTKGTFVLKGSRTVPRSKAQEGLSPTHFFRLSLYVMALVEELLVTPEPYCLFTDKFLI
jgi:hypothetical protein